MGCLPSPTKEKVAEKLDEVMCVIISLKFIQKYAF